MPTDEVREAAKAEIRYRLWASERGKATRAYIREHPELVEEYSREGRITIVGELPEYVTEASVILELAQRARRREVSKAVRQWRRDNPEEAARIKQKVMEEYGLSNSSKTKGSTRKVGQ